MARSPAAYGHTALHARTNHQTPDSRTRVHPALGGQRDQDGQRARRQQPDQRHERRREHDQRARDNAAKGIRLHEPTPENPALVIITDEHAELPAEAHESADSVARRGRAVAVNLIAATQRPTQAAMGKDTAVRSQMDVRICLRVREKRDVDLILGQGAVNSGWHAHQFTQPGQFLISDPEHAAPKRHRAYLIDDDRIARHAARCPEPATAAGHAPERPTIAADGRRRPGPWSWPR